MRLRWVQALSHRTRKPRSYAHQITSKTCFPMAHSKAGVASLTLQSRVQIVAGTAFNPRSAL